MKPLPSQPLIAKGDLQNPVRRAALDYLRAHPRSTFAQIEAATMAIPGGAGANLRYHLNHMVGRHHLYVEQSSAGIRWSVGPKPAPAPAANVAPPRQVQVMFGPVYVPPRSPALRHGAMDFKACASRGHAC